MYFFFFFFFKQKTAYEILTCDWSSDVCSSDLTDTDEGSAESSYRDEDIAAEGGNNARDEMSLYH